MEFITYGLMFLIGVVVSRLLFGGSKLGPFEESIIQNLMLGKRVIVSIEDDCYIFEMHDKRLRITRGVAMFYGEEDNGTPNHLALVDSDPVEPSDDPSTGG